MTQSMFYAYSQVSNCDFIIGKSYAIIEYTEDLHIPSNVMHLGTLCSVKNLSDSDLQNVEITVCKKDVEKRYIVDNSSKYYEVLTHLCPRDESNAESVDIITNFFKMINKVVTDYYFMCRIIHRKNEKSDFEKKIISTMKVSLRKVWKYATQTLVHHISDSDKLAVFNGLAIFEESIDAL